MYFDKPLFLERLNKLIETRPEVKTDFFDHMMERLNKTDIITQAQASEIIEYSYSRQSKLIRRPQYYKLIKNIFNELSTENKLRLRALPKGAKIIYQCVVGSQSFGTATPTSDYDLKGIYVQDNLDFGTLERYKPSVTIGKDEIYFEIRRYMELLLEGEAIAMEMLFSPKRCVTIETPEMKFVKAHKDKFIVKKLYYTFYNYAIKQFKKATNYNKMSNWDESRSVRQPISNFCKICDRETGKTYLFTDFLAEKNIDTNDITLTKLDGMVNNYKVYHHKSRGWYTDKSNEVRTGEVPKEKNNEWLGVLSFNHSEYSAHCKYYTKYQKWVVDRSEERYNVNKEHGQKYDAKNIMHTVRLIMTSMDIPKHRTIVVERTNERDYLLDIKFGNLPLKEVLDEWLEKSANIENEFNATDLPKSADKKLAEYLLYKIRVFQKVPKREVLKPYI